MKIEHLNLGRVRMIYPEISKDGVRKQLIRVFLRLLHVIPGKGMVMGMLAKIPRVRKTYHWSFRFFPHEILFEVQGSKMYVRPRDGAIDRELLMTKIYEKAETSVFHKFIRRGMTVLDLGANIGYFTLIAAKLVGPEGKVFAFEPEPANFSLLQRNVNINGYENVTLVQKAVSDKNGVEELYLCSDSWGHSLCSFKRDEDLISVPVTSLDQFFSDDIAIDFIKMDIEGAEGKAVQGMERILGKGDVKVMIIEVHREELERQGSSFRQLWDKLTTFGFQSCEMNDKTTKGIDFGQALYLANKGGGYINLLCLRK
jgi:FkbM family methyltransferase